MFSRLVSASAALVSAVVSVSAVSSTPAVTTYGPVPYLSRADSPLAPYFGQPGVYFDDLTDSSFDLPGVTFSPSVSVISGGIVDSVDGDDGEIDGFGTAGSIFSGNGPGGITLTFSVQDLGRLPVYAGLVWTDAGLGADVTFRAWDGKDNLLWEITAPALADFSNSSTTAEDRLFAVYAEQGIGKLFVSNSSGGIEIDHIQFATEMIPEPSTWALGGLGLLGMAGWLWRRNRIR